MDFARLLFDESTRDPANRRYILAARPFTEEQARLVAHRMYPRLQPEDLARVDWAELARLWNEMEE